MDLADHGHIDRIPFQSFGLMNGHHADYITIKGNPSLFLEEIALFDYEDDEEIPWELQRTLSLLLSSYSLLPKIEKRIKKKLSSLDE